MKHLIIITITIFSIGSWAGDKVGNGGGLWVCPNAKNITRGLLVDLFEGREQYGLNIISPTASSVNDIIEERRFFIQNNAPQFFVEWDQFLTDFSARVKYTNSELKIVDDALYIIQPLSVLCNEPWKYTQFANFTTLGQALIRADLWNSPAIENVDKAALIWHEVIYHWMRVNFKAEDSVITRQVVARIFSNDYPQDLYTDLYKIIHGFPPPPPVVPKKLYLAAGLCYAGSGITTYSASTASRAITRWESDSGNYGDTIMDLNTSPTFMAGTTPQALVDFGNGLLVLTENATTVSDQRKILLVDKLSPNQFKVWANDPDAFTTTPSDITRAMAIDTTGSLQFSKSTAIEKITSTGQRVVQGKGHPWIEPITLGIFRTGCFSEDATLITAVHIMPPLAGSSGGKTIYLHAGNTYEQNRIGVIHRMGMLAGSGCTTSFGIAGDGISHAPHLNGPGLNGPVSFLPSGASPTSMVYIETPAPATTTGKLIVSYSAAVNTAFDNDKNFNYGIVLWDIEEPNDKDVILGNPTIIWRDESVVWAPSAMAYNKETKSLYVAVGGVPGVINQTYSNTGFNVEKFTLDLNAPSLTRISTNNQPFIRGNSNTKCISSMVIGE